MLKTPKTWPRFNVHLLDEVPSVGCGLRVVEAQIGRKWVRVRLNNQHHASRVKRQVWDKLGATTA